MDWKYYKDLGAWPLVFQQDKSFYNEGNRMSTADDPVWKTAFTGKPNTPTHHPGCGYWHDEPADADAAAVKLEFPSNPYYPNPDPCIDDPMMQWDIDSVDYIDRNSVGLVSVKGNNHPFNWKIFGSGFSLASLETVGLENTIIADDSACGMAKIKVTGCDGVEVEGWVSCLWGEWVYKSSNICEIYGSIGIVDVILPGTYPYTYTVIGQSGGTRQKDTRSYNLYGVCKLQGSHVTCEQALAHYCNDDTECMNYTSPCAQLGSGFDLICSMDVCRYPCTCDGGIGNPNRVCGMLCGNWYLDSRTSWEWKC